MSIVIKEDPSMYPVPEEGLHPAVLIDCVDLGEIETQFGSKRKVSLIFELQEIDENRDHFIVGKRFTKSLNQRSNLRKFLEKWRGEKYSPDELQKGVDLENMLGMSATLFIVHNETEERTYANIESVLPYKNDQGVVSPYELKPSGQYIRVIDREGYQQPEEYAESVNGQD